LPEKQQTTINTESPTELLTGLSPALSLHRDKTELLYFYYFSITNTACSPVAGYLAHIKSCAVLKNYLIK
jgi:hypothetical protein